MTPATPAPAAASAALSMSSASRGGPAPINFESIVELLLKKADADVESRVENLTPAQINNLMTAIAKRTLIEGLDCASRLPQKVQRKIAKLKDFETLIKVLASEPRNSKFTEEQIKKLGEIFKSSGSGPWYSIIWNCLYNFFASGGIGVLRTLGNVILASGYCNGKAPPNSYTATSQIDFFEKFVSLAGIIVKSSIDFSMLGCGVLFFYGAESIRWAVINNRQTDYGGLDDYASHESLKLSPLLGRDTQIKEILHSLQSRRHVLLVAEPGAGKTTLIMELGRLIAKQAAETNSSTAVEIRGGSAVFLLPNPGMYGDEERLKALVESCNEKVNEVIIFLDEFHVFMSAEHEIKMGTLIKSLTDKSGFNKKCIFIGATTRAEYEKYVKPDPAIVRRFQIVDVPQLHEDVNIQILRNQANLLNKSVELLPKAMKLCAEIPQMAYAEIAIRDAFKRKMVQCETPPASEELNKLKHKKRRIEVEIQSSLSTAKVESQEKDLKEFLAVEEQIKSYREKAKKARNNRKNLLEVLTERNICKYYILDVVSKAAWMTRGVNLIAPPWGDRSLPNKKRYFVASAQLNIEQINKEIETLVANVKTVKNLVDKILKRFETNLKKTAGDANSFTNSLKSLQELKVEGIVLPKLETVDRISWYFITHYVAIGKAIQNFLTTSRLFSEIELKHLASFQQLAANKFPKISTAATGAPTSSAAAPETKDNAFTDTEIQELEILADDKKTDLPTKVGIETVKAFVCILNVDHYGMNTLFTRIKRAFDTQLLLLFKYKLSEIQERLENAEEAVRKELVDLAIEHQSHYKMALSNFRSDIDEDFMKEIIASNVPTNVRGAASSAAAGSGAATSASSAAAGSI